MKFDVNSTRKVMCNSVHATGKVTRTHPESSYAYSMKCGILVIKLMLRVLALTTISLCRNEQQGGAT